MNPSTRPELNDVEVSPPADEVETPSVLSARNPPHGYTGTKEAYLRRLRRIEGQVRGIARMVDEDKYCIDILTQVSAINKALHAVSIGLLEEHIAHCVVGAAQDARTEDGAENVSAKVKEASDAIARLLRS